MKRFDFVGLLEHYEEDMARLCGMLGLSYRPTHANAASSDYEIPVELRDRFTRANPEEMALYEAGRARRRELLSAAE